MLKNRLFRAFAGCLLLSQVAACAGAQLAAVEPPAVGSAATERAIALCSTYAESEARRDVQQQTVAHSLIAVGAVLATTGVATFYAAEQAGGGKRDALKTLGGIGLIAGVSGVFSGTLIKVTNDHGRRAKLAAERTVAMMRAVERLNNLDTDDNEDGSDESKPRGRDLEAAEHDKIASYLHRCLAAPPGDRGEPAETGDARTTPRPTSPVTPAPGKKGEEKK